MSKAKVTVLVESEFGLITGEYMNLDYGYDYGQILSEEARKAIEKMALLLERRLEGVR